MAPPREKAHRESPPARCGWLSRHVSLKGSWVTTDHERFFFFSRRTVGLLAPLRLGAWYVGTIPQQDPFQCQSDHAMLEFKVSVNPSLTLCQTRILPWVSEFPVAVVTNDYTLGA